MNIFVTNPCPHLSAKYLDDKRVIKMILESAQMLNVALINTYKTDGIGYKLTHVNHPCTKWVCSNSANYTWLYLHFISLCAEYTKRYNKVHKCEQYASTFNKYIDNSINVSNINFVNCTTYHKHITNVFDAYKAEMAFKWKNDIRVPTKYKLIIKEF